MESCEVDSRIIVCLSCKRIFMMAYVIIKTFFLLSVFAPVPIWTKEFKQRGTTISFGDETRDLENRPYKTHKADFGDDHYTEKNDNVTVQNCTNNTIDNNGGLWLKNCSNNSMNEEEVFGNCTKHCIECKDQECKGCEIGFYGQNCHLRCLLDCGVDGCYQFTGKCQVSEGSCEAEINTVVIYAGICAGSGLVLGILVCKIIERLCRRRNQPKGENQKRDIPKYGLKCHRACSQHCPGDTGPFWKEVVKIDNSNLFYHVYDPSR